MLEAARPGGLALFSDLDPSLLGSDFAGLTFGLAEQTVVVAAAAVQRLLDGADALERTADQISALQTVAPAAPSGSG